MTDKEKKQITDSLDQTRKLFKNKKLDEAQDIISASIAKFTDDEPKKEDDETLYFDFKTAIEESIYRNEEKPEKTILLPEIPVSNIYLISGSIAMEQEDYGTSLERLEEAMEWNPINPDIAFQYAEVVKRMGSYDQFLELTKRIFPHIYLPSQLAHAYRNVGFYFETKNQTKNAMAAFFFSLGYEDNEAVKHEIAELAKEVPEGERSLDLGEFQKVCEENDIPFGPDPDVVNLAYASGVFFKRENEPMRAFYFLNIAYALTRDEKLKPMIEEEGKKIKEAEKE